MMQCYVKDDKHGYVKYQSDYNNHNFFMTQKVTSKNCQNALCYKNIQCLNEPMQGHVEDIKIWHDVKFFQVHGQLNFCCLTYTEIYSWKLNCIN